MAKKAFGRGAVALLLAVGAAGCSSSGGGGGNVSTVPQPCASSSLPWSKAQDSLYLPTDPSPTNVLFNAYDTNVGAQQSPEFNMTLVFTTTPSGLSQFVSSNSLPTAVTAPANAALSILTADPVSCFTQFKITDYANDMNMGGVSGNDVSYAVDESDPQSPRVMVTYQASIYVQPGS